MFRFQVRNDAQPRSKKGQPDHRITGVDNTSSIHIDSCSPKKSRTAVMPRKGVIVSTSKGTVSTVATHRRRVKSTSSGFGPSSAAAEPASSCRPMPHSGQAPGTVWRTSVCIGQV